MNNIKKSLLYIVTQAEWGGAQKYVFDLAMNLTEEFDITVAAGADGSSRELLDKLASTGVKNFTFKHLKRDISLWHDVLAVFEIAKFLRQNNFDIIHLNSTKAGVIGAMAAWLNRFLALLGMTKRGLQISYLSGWQGLGMAKNKIIYTAHGWAYSEPLPFYKRRLYLLMEKIAARLRDRTIVLSEKEKQNALQHGTAKPDAVSIIANGLDLANLQFFTKEQARQKLNLEQNQTIIGTIANLYKTKGLEYFIEAAGIINSEHLALNFKLMIIGEGPECTNLESKIKNY
ncbi:glycosyltransferase, partial [Candidatus Falkowbacteria bacterium]|nr:glycosyltransferase [Candidatus Falkowbacteria bacterium]